MKALPKRKAAAYGRTRTARVHAWARVEQRPVHIAGDGGRAAGLKEGRNGGHHRGCLEERQSQNGHGDTGAEGGSVRGYEGKEEKEKDKGREAGGRRGRMSENEKRGAHEDETAADPFSGACRCGGTRGVCPDACPRCRAALPLQPTRLRTLPAVVGSVPRRTSPPQPPSPAAPPPPPHHRPATGAGRPYPTRSRAARHPPWRQRLVPPSRRRGRPPIRRPPQTPSDCEAWAQEKRRSCSAVTKRVRMKLGMIWSSSS